MSNIKKIIGVVLALVMVLSVATVAFAAEEATYSVVITSDKATLAAGDSANITVSLTTNYYVSTMSIPVFFDNKLVTVSNAKTDLTGDSIDIAIVTEGAENIADLYTGSGYTEADHGVLALTYIAKDGADIQSYNNTTVMTFTVTALANVSGEAVVNCVAGTVKTSTNENGKLYVGKNSNGTNVVDSSAVVVDAANLTAATATISIGGGATQTPEIVAIAGGTGVVDTENHYLYGIEPGTTDINTVFTATNNGKLRMADGFTVIGTGTVIELVSADGATVVDSYTVVIFGDVNADGIIDLKDANAIKLTALGSSELLGANIFAADVDADGEISLKDANAVKLGALGSSAVTINPYA